MKIETLFLRNNSRFSHYLVAWANERNFTVGEFSEKEDDIYSNIDGLVIFSQNQTVDKELSEIRDHFDKKQKPVHKIDINGTLMVGVSNLDLWFERNKCKKVLFIGSDALLDNPNLERYLSSLN